MKRLVGILAMTLVTTLPALAAQPERDPQELALVRQRLREVEDHLSLTPEQAEQVGPVIAGMLLSMKDVRDDYGFEGQGRRSRRRMARELRAIRSYADERLKLFLSRAQIEELKSIRKDWRDEFPTEVALAAR